MDIVILESRVKNLINKFIDSKLKNLTTKTELVGKNKTERTKFLDDKGKMVMFRTVHLQDHKNNPQEPFVSYWVVFDIFETISDLFSLDPRNEEWSVDKILKKWIFDNYGEKPMEIFTFSRGEEEYVY